MEVRNKYFAIFRLSVINKLKNYKELVGLNLFLVTCLVIFAHLWKVAAAKMGAAELHPDQLLWYIAFNEWVLISVPELQFDMEEDLRSGKLAYFLPRPVSYLGSVFMEGFGALCVNLLVLGLVAFSFTWWRAGGFSFDPANLGVIVGLGAMAGCLGILFNMLVGISGFWLHDVSPFNWIWEKTLFALGGLLLPLTVYPEWLQKIASWTPFPAILGARSALAIEFSMAAALQVTVSLLAWAVMALSALTFFYRRGLRIIHIEGG